MSKHLKRFYFVKKKEIRRLKRAFRGSSKDPLFLLGMISVILFGLVILGSASLPNSLNKGDFSIAAVSKLFDKSVEQNSFLGPINKFGPESPEFLLVENNSLRAATPPTKFSPQVFGALIGGYELEDTKKVITEYIVESGDNLWSIATKFNISLETLLWANDLNKYTYIQSGQKLIILPVSGVVHHVKSGDTISTIAKKYKGKADEIIAFNDLSGEGDIYIGDIVIIPNGEIPAPSTRYAPVWVPLANSYFICPIASPCRITQGLHWYNAIDFSHGKCGEPIYAAAAGTVLKVKLTSSRSRWAFNGAGNYLTILHPNGVVTMYGHLANSFVNPGEQISQGQVIALMGGQPGTPGAGLSSGCHLHFGVAGARNPFAR
jgi:LysM repeat protein